MSGVLVGPVTSDHVTFRGGPAHDIGVVTAVLAYDVPANTCDPRYVTCTDHHVACDCREAEIAEDRSEFSAWRREVEQAFAEILAGHPTMQYDGSGEPVACMCTGCQIARAAHMPWYQWQRGAATF